LEKKVSDKKFDKLAYAEASAKYWKGLYKSLQDQPHRADLFTRYRYRQEGIQIAKGKIAQNIKERIEDLKACHKDDNCVEFASLLEEYLPEWLETGFERG